MFVGQDAASGGKGNQDGHDDIEKNAERTLLDVTWQSEHSTEENGGDGHGVRRGKTWLARPVGASAQDDKFVENDVDCN